MKATKLTRLALASMMTCTMALTTLSTMTTTIVGATDTEIVHGNQDKLPESVTMKIHKMKFLKNSTAAQQNTGQVLTGYNADAGLGNVDFQSYEIRALYDALLANSGQAGWPTVTKETIADYISLNWNALKGTYGELIASKGIQTTSNWDTSKGIATFTGMETKTGTGKYAIYLFEELESEGNKNMLQSLPIIAGFPIKKGKTHLDTVHLYVKNSGISKALDKKGGITEDHKAYNFEVGEIINYTATAHIPVDLSKYTTLKIQDTMTHVGTDLKTLTVFAGSEDITQLLLDAQVLTRQSDPAGFTLEIDLTNSKMSDLVKKLAGKSLSFKYEMVINDQAAPSQDYQNKFTVALDDQLLETNAPKIETGGYKFKKVDSEDGAALSGAKFVIKRKLNNRPTEYAQFTANGSVQEDWVVESGLYTPSDIEWVTDKKDATQITSGTDGLLQINGLKSGDYQLEETAAPNGYVMMTGTTKFTVAKGKAGESFIKTKKTEVKNTPEDGLLPITGSTGIAAFLIMGTAAMGTAVVIKKRRA
ncbi:SpaH/EbpB family LPXTG-anchored major pilin [Lacticaseibacillus absianus]|uniref:SpaH/EbpB family LPXTG-anchored major pilin n=1 Tax=Lacticaseibacillus absianus TaxID=2729623 RepID=UPI0015CC268B|nr:SpaH/EbpB family LPXTG-anchored major pilin [Lacticaseibacillus absianus]